MDNNYFKNTKGTSFHGDLAIFYAAYFDPKSSTLAYAVPCDREYIRVEDLRHKERTRVGKIMFNLAQVTERLYENTGSLESEYNIAKLAVHEIFHVLGFI